MTDPLDHLSWLLVALAALDWVFTTMLVIGARRIGEPALTERASMSIILSLAATAIAVLALAFLARQVLLPELRFGMLIFSLIAISVPQLVWGTLFLAGRFR